MLLNILSFLCKLTVTLKCTHCKWNYFLNILRAPFILRKTGLAANATELWLTESTKGHFERSSHNQPHSLVKRMHKQEFTFPHKNISLACNTCVTGGTLQTVLGPAAATASTCCSTPTLNPAGCCENTHTTGPSRSNDSLRPAQCNRESRQNVHTAHAMRNQMSTNVIVPRLLPVLGCRQTPRTEVGKFPEILSLKAKESSTVAVFLQLSQHDGWVHFFAQCDRRTAEQVSRCLFWKLRFDDTTNYMLREQGGHARCALHSSSYP